MGATLNTYKLWEKDPKYDNIKNKIQTFDKDSQELIHDFLKEQDNVQAEKAKLKQQNEEYLKLHHSLKEENKTLKLTIEKLKHKNNVNKKDPPARSMSREEIETTKIVDEFLTQQDELKKKIQNLEKELELLTKENHKLDTNNKILLVEKESALSRLSKIAGIQLTKGNSDIADLSDVNRPTSLAEKYGSLYTEEWMEAYEEMVKTVKNENNKCEIELYNIVKSCYTICQNLERKQMTDIKAHAWDIACSLHQQPDQLVSETKTTKYHVMNITHNEGKNVIADSMTPHQQAKVNVKAATMAPKQQPNAGFDIKILAIHKCMEELIEIVHERRKYDKQLMEYVKQETLKHFQHYIRPGSNDRVINYVRKCTELCWSMVIKNPPMVLVCDQLEGKPVDRSMFTFYTKQGPVIDFIVWPPLILHIKGPVLQKGVVEGKEESGKQSRTMHIDVSPSKCKD